VHGAFREGLALAPYLMGWKKIMLILNTFENICIFIHQMMVHQT